MQDYEIGLMAINDEPKSYEEAMERSDAREWKEAINRELAELHENNTWTESEVPKGEKSISSRWVFKIKNTNAGEKEYKARLIARGFEQRESFELSEIYAPVARLPTFRLFIAIATELGIPVYQMDVRSAFLYGDIKEDVYMKLPSGAGSKSDTVKLNRSLYGLKKSPKCWNEKFDSVMKSEGFERSVNDYCLYMKFINSEKLYLLLNVDDLLFCGTNEMQIEETKKTLKQNFKMKDIGRIKNYLGIDVNQNIETGVTELSQERYLGRVS